MSAVKELIRSESNGTLSFGDYTLESKQKLDQFEFEGDFYKVKTFRDMTKLERNGMFVYESVPGTAVNNFSASDEGLVFCVSGAEDAQITVGLEEETEYEVSVDGVSVGIMRTNLGGKLSVNVEPSAGGSEVCIKKQ